MQTDRIPPGKVPPSERFIDDDRHRGLFLVLIRAFLHWAAVLQREIAPGDERHAQRGKIIWADLVHVRFRMIVRS